MATLFKLYTRVLYRHPWKTQVITTGTLMACGDVIAQTAVEKRPFNQIELLRVGRYAFLGLVFVGPLLRVWYLTLDWKFGVVGWSVGLKKMLTDQFLFCPCFIGCFLTLLGVLQLQPWQVIKEKINEDYVKIMKANYMLWPPAQLITFYIIPSHFRIPFVSCVALFWNTYLAAKANKNFKL